MDQKEKQSLISVVVPLYNEEVVVKELYHRLTKVLEELKTDYEIVIVNDGSNDQTPEIVKGACRQDKRVKLISFSRNFGHQLAITAGIDKSVGDAVVVIDGDLQDPPEVIAELKQKWDEGFEIVYARRKKRKGDSLFKLATAAIFYRIMKILVSVDIPLDTGDFRLMDRKAVDQLKKMREKNRFIRGMVSWLGFRHCTVEYVREPRFAGETKYPLKKMVKFALDGILSFSKISLKLSSFMGFICSIVSFIFIIYGLFVKIFTPEQAIPGWASVFVSVLFLGGIQLICIGILGEYVGRIYDETKKRPLYIIDEEINFN